MSVRHRATPHGGRHGQPPLRHSAGRRPRREGSTRAGLLGLGGYGVGLSAIGVVSLAAPLVAVAAGAGPGATTGIAELVGAGGVGVVPAARPAAGSQLAPGREIAPSGSGLQGSGRAAAVPEVNQGEALRRGPAFRPVRLVLPDSISAPVLPAGLNDDGTFAVPELPSQLGWWTGGARAGDPFGSMVIAGHVDSYRYGLGALHRLGKIKRGAVIEARAGSQKLRYRVTSVGSIPQARLARDTTAFRQDVAHRLVLITCGGPFDRVRHRYTENIVVVAAPVT